MAGKASRKRSKERRKKEKQSRKAARRAIYAAWRDAGENKKSKRSVLRHKRQARRRLKHFSHPLGPCGNIGCAKCFPDMNIRKHPVKLKFKERVTTEIST